MCVCTCFVVVVWAEDEPSGGGFNDGQRARKKGEGGATGTASPLVTPSIHGTLPILPLYIHIYIYTYIMIFVCVQVCMYVCMYVRPLWWCGRTDGASGDGSSSGHSGPWVARV